MITKEYFDEKQKNNYWDRLSLAAIMHSNSIIYKNGNNTEAWEASYKPDYEYGYGVSQLVFKIKEHFSGSDEDYDEVTEEMVSQADHTVSKWFDMNVGEFLTLVRTGPPAVEQTS